MCVFSYILRITMSHCLAFTRNASGDWNPRSFRRCLVSLRRPLQPIAEHFSQRDIFVCAPSDVKHP
jgi:hypothetical protein